MICPVCGLDAEVVDGVFGSHRNTGLERCYNVGQPAKKSEPKPEPKSEEPKTAPKPVSKTAPKKAAKKAAPKKK